MAETINMITCIYCNETYIREDTELVCKECEPALTLDLVVSSLLDAISDLGKVPPEDIGVRMDILTSAHQALGKIISKAKEEDLSKS